MDKKEAAKIGKLPPACMDLDNRYFESFPPNGFRRERVQGRYGIWQGLYI